MAKIINFQDKRLEREQQKVLDIAKQLQGCKHVIEIIEHDKDKVSTIAMPHNLSWFFGIGLESAIENNDYDALHDFYMRQSEINSIALINKSREVSLSFTDTDEKYFFLLGVGCGYNIPEGVITVNVLA